MPIRSDFTERYYLLDLNFYSLYHEGDRILLDSVEDSLVEYLKENYSVDKRKDNLIFDLQKELKYAQGNNSSHRIELTAINDIDKCFLSTVIPLKPHDNSLKSSWDIPPNSRTLL